MCILGGNHFVSVVLFLNYFYSYNSNASLKIVILHMFSAEQCHCRAVIKLAEAQTSVGLS